MSAGILGSTHGLGIVSSEAGVLWMSVVRGMREVGGVCEMWMCMARGGVGGEMMRGLGLGFTNHVGTGGVLDICLFGLRWCRWGGAWRSVMYVRVESPDSLCRWQVQVSVYCSWRIPAHLRYTQCSILLHLMDICFIPCICLWQISQIQTCLCVHGCRTWICLDITLFYEEQRQPSSGSA